MKYSIRMRSAQGGAHENGGTHISGAERIVAKNELETLAQELIQRALTHSKGEADFIRITIDKIEPKDIIYAPLLKVQTSMVDDYHKGRTLALQLLKEFGVTREAANTALNLLSKLERNYRGAIICDAKTGKRIDNTADKGVRVSRMDYADLTSTIKKANEYNFQNNHFREALALASKVLSAPGIIAELCWSDDPDYVTGYVSGSNIYHRISHLKPENSPLGGRVFFVNTDKIDNLDEVIDYLEKQVVLIK